MTKEYSEPPTQGDSQTQKEVVTEPAAPSRSFFFEFKVADEKTCKVRWSCDKPGVRFRCGFCGHKFVVGDEYRAIYTNDMANHGGNPLTCRACFTEHGEVNGLRERWKVMWAEVRSFQERFWWWNDERD